MGGVTETSWNAIARYVQGENNSDGTDKALTRVLERLPDLRHFDASGAPFEEYDIVALFAHRSLQTVKVRYCQSLECFPFVSPNGLITSLVVSDNENLLCFYGGRMVSTLLRLSIVSNQSLISLHFGSAVAEFTPPTKEQLNKILVKDGDEERGYTFRRSGSLPAMHRPFTPVLFKRRSSLDARINTIKAPVLPPTLGQIGESAASKSAPLAGRSSSFSLGKREPRMLSRRFGSVSFSAAIAPSEERDRKLALLAEAIDAGRQKDASSSGDEGRPLKGRMGRARSFSFRRERRDLLEELEKDVQKLTLSASKESLKEKKRGSSFSLRRFGSKGKGKALQEQSDSESEGERLVVDPPMIFGTSEGEEEPPRGPFAKLKRRFRRKSGGVLDQPKEEMTVSPSPSPEPSLEEESTSDEEEQSDALFIPSYLLREIVVEGCKSLVDLPDLSCFPMLRSCQIKNNQSLCGIFPFEGFGLLTTLVLEDLQLNKRPPKIANNPHLTTLVMHRMLVLKKGPDIENNPQLETIDLSYNLVMETLGTIDRCPALQKLDVRHCVRLTSVDGCPKIRSLWVDGSKVPSK